MKKLKDTKVVKTVNKIVTAPVRFVKKGIAKEKAYNDYKQAEYKRQADDLYNNL